MTIIGAFLLPHGSLLLDPSVEGLTKQAGELHNGMVRIKNIVKELSPDLCLLITPHGISHSTQFCLYQNQLASGSAEWDDKYKEFTVEVNIDCKETTRLIEFLQTRKNPVDRLTAHSPSVPIPLRWGEVVPLWFLKDLSLTYQIMSLPTRRYDTAIDMIPELQKLGRDLKEYYLKSDRDVIIIISGDLSHTHQIDGPYGHKPEAEMFDSLIEEWVKKMESSLLTKHAGKVLDSALCCGFTGLIILDEILKGLELSPQILAHDHPTYYGMLIASFT